MSELEVFKYLEGLRTVNFGVLEKSCFKVVTRLQWLHSYGQKKVILSISSVQDFC